VNACREAIVEVPSAILVACPPRGWRRAVAKYQAQFLPMLLVNKDF
jgi:hypothetical protein